MRQWTIILALLAAGALLIGQDADEWAARFANWTAIRDADAPIRNAVHLRQTVTLGPTQAIQTNFWRVPSNRRLHLQQAAVYCTFTTGRLDQAHIVTAVNNTGARYPLLRSTLEGGLNYLSAPINMYADPGTPVEVTLGFSFNSVGVCEITATGYTAQLNQ
jgi:hypothetical protein